MQARPGIHQAEPLEVMLASILMDTGLGGRHDEGSGAGMTGVGGYDGMRHGGTDRGEGTGVNSS
ncbi:MAG: hypothetical protein O7D36_08080 [Gammaproteobacteria bacterium]|nr:hypothetical protein [Gammaproteobacteria bacterium]